MNFGTNLWNNFVDSFPSFLLAILYLLLAFLVAWLAKKLIMAILRKTGIDQKLAKTGIKDQKTGSTTEFVGKLVFLIVFLLFLPAVLSRLGMTNVAQPITDMIYKIIGFLPRLLAAGLILFIGIYVAKIIRELLRSLLNRIGLDKVQRKLVNGEVQENHTFSNVLAGIVYVIVLIPIIIAALQVLKLEAISVPATTILNKIFEYIPKIFVAVILLIIGYQLAKILARIVEDGLVSVGLDRGINKLFKHDPDTPTKVSVSKVIAEIVRWLLLIFFFVEAVQVLNLSILTGIGSAIISYLPLILSAIIIMGGGYLLATWLERLIVKNAPQHRTLATVIKVSLIVLAAFMTLSQLGFARSIVEKAFVMILGAIAVAFAISFGVGGREFASKQLSKLDDKIDDHAKAAKAAKAKPAEKEPAK